MAELGKGGRVESCEVVDEVLRGAEIISGIWAEEWEGFGVDLTRRVEEGREGEDGVFEADRAEVGRVDLIAEFEGEGAEPGEGYCSGEG